MEHVVRRLTPTECERLQGFPDGYTQLGDTKDAPRYRALGNSMAVPVMRWIGERMELVDEVGAAHPQNAGEPSHIQTQGRGWEPTEGEHKWVKHTME